MPDDMNSITVVADPSLSLPLTKIARKYSKEKQISVAIAFFPAARQESEFAANEGAAYDVLITPRVKLLESLKQQGMVDIYSEVVVARNRLVLTAAVKNDFHASLANAFPLNDFLTYFQGQPKLLVGNPEAMIEGSIAREALRKQGVLEDLEPYTLYISSLPEMMTMVQDEGKLAFMFESDARQHEGLKIVDHMALGSYEPVSYIGVVLAGDKMEDARAFLDYIRQSAQQDILQSYYFQ